MKSKIIEQIDEILKTEGGEEIWEPTKVDWETEELIGKIKDLPYDEKMKMIFQWVKTGHIKLYYMKKLIAFAEKERFAQYGNKNT